MNIEECYKIFELQYNSTEKEIKTRYKNLVLKYHPDKNKHKDTTKKLIKINRAYKILLNKKKSEYNEYFINLPTFNWTSTDDNTIGSFIYG